MPIQVWPGGDFYWVPIWREIEITQNLRIKEFLGNSEKAVKTPIWCAISTYVRMVIVKKELQLNASLLALLQILSVSLVEKTEGSTALEVDHNTINCNK